MDPHAWPFVAMWVAWAAIWAWLAPDVKATARHESLASRVAHIAPLALAVLLLGWPGRLLGPLDDPVWPRGLPGTAIGAALTLAGLACSVAARVRLGRNWSGTVTLKQDHQLVTDGPYALVRHPIYTGLIVGLLATAVAEATVTGVIGAALVIFGIYLKASSEERFLRVELGPDAYDSYRRRVPMLVPYLKLG